MENKFFFFIIVFFNFQLAFGQDFKVSLIKNKAQIELITNAINSKNKNYEVVKNQVISVITSDSSFVIAPIISTAEKNGGCHLQSLNNNYQLGAQYLIEKNEDVQSCDAVIAIFGCRLAKTNGIGVIAGIRLGANNYFSQSVFFEITEHNELKYSLQRSNLISSIGSVLKAKKKLGCNNLY